ncbi:ABC transporter ATP-binding protein [Musicola paradisiaca]|uniref:ABC transporter related n=1 Tax=Musicola paradisiaca (strain Ech703) TaxID=579405 RepID=C6C318_MUSP7|nr:ABC transporter ATP-binding protein [Musicola paradisiaca]ACS85283.1 ABC transporter related [Musicola paradisiaca Ech703]
MSDILLCADQLACGHAPGQALFEPVSLSLRRGEITAVLGGNGRGKTTLMQTLLGVLPPLSGRVERHGLIGFVPQRFTPPFPYSVLDIVLMGRARQVGLFSMPSAHDIAQARAALTSLGMDALADRPFDRLSGGQQQLVLIARALATECQVLLLDEPTAALDLAHQSAVLVLLQRLAREQKISVMFSTHDPAHGVMIAQRALLLMNDGGYLYGPNATTLTETHLSRLYGVPIRSCSLEWAGQRYSTLVPLFSDITP